MRSKHQKTLTLALENHEASNGVQERFPSTHVSQLSLLEESLMIHIERPWKSVGNTRTEINGRK
jgi:hypothetical protein